jgi:nicotinamidase-related amidase
MAKASEFENHCWKGLFSEQLIKQSSTYVRETHVGDKPGLLLIDLYNFVYDGGNRPVHEIEEEFSLTCGEYAWNAIEPTKHLIAAARNAGIPIIYSTRHLDTGDVFSTKSVVRRKRGPDAYEIFPAFAPQPGDTIIYKERASAFYGTPLIAHLNHLGVRSLVVCGESTSGCVRNSVQDAYMNGYHVSIVEECTYDRNIISHKVNLFDMHHKYADVMCVDEIIEHFNGLSDAGKEEAIQKRAGRR